MSEGRDFIQFVRKNSREIVRVEITRRLFELVVTALVDEADDMGPNEALWAAMDGKPFRLRSVLVFKEDEPVLCS